VERKWLVGIVAGVLALAAVLALIVGGVVGRSIVPSPATTPSATTTTAAPPAPPTVRFRDTLTDIGIAYPSDWVRRISKDQNVRVLVSSPDGTAGVSVSVRNSGLEKVTAQTLPVVKPLTDDLIRGDNRIKEKSDPTPVMVAGLPGYRYRYTYTTADKTVGAHDHYFLFKTGQLIQLVMQVEPSTELRALQPTFDRIAGSLRIGR
jgi:hypothetical protein